MKTNKCYRQLLASVFIFCCLFHGVVSAVLAENLADNLTEKPNIILILTDDQPYGYLGVTGNKYVQTPNLDAIANAGVLFTNAHVTSAICTPSRASILLGQYERKHGVNFNSGTSMSASAWQNSYPIKVREAGYYTGWIGKNHVPIGEGGYQSGLMEKSFDYWYAGHGHLGFYPKLKHGIFGEANSDTQVEIVNEGVDDFLDTNEHKFTKAITFLDKRPIDKPFMLSINFNLPHGAGTSTMALKPSDDELYRSQYRAIKFPLPEHYVAKADITTPKLPADLLRAEDRQTGYNWVDTPEGFQERYVRHMQAMTGIDRLVGNLVERLKIMNIADNTVIIFTSDHGLFNGEFGLGGKALCYEKNTHVPLIIFDPRQSQTIKTSHALVQSIDIAPTILSLTGATVPKAMQGQTLAPLLQSQSTNQPAEQRQYAFSENLWSTHFGNPRCEAIQNKEWKYIRYYKNNTMSASKKIAFAKQLNIPENKMLYAVHDNDIAVYRDYIESSLNGEPVVYEELYHLATDPKETTNVINDKQFEPILNTLRKDWLNALTFARDIKSGATKVNRYTSDSQLESNKPLHFE